MRIAKIMAFTVRRAHYTSISLSVGREATTVTVRGRIVHGESSAGYLSEALVRTASRNTKAIKIDLRDVYQLDLSGIGVLAFAYSTAKDASIHFKVENAPGFIVDLLKLYHLDGILLTPHGDKGAYGTAA